MRGVSVDVGLGRLAGYAREHGHANPPVRGEWLDWQIGGWVSSLRKKKRLGALSPEQIAEAERLGIDWDPPSHRRPQPKPPTPTPEQRRETRLHAQLDRLIPYWQHHGPIDILQLVGTEDWPEAGRFIGRLRGMRRAGTLPETVEARAEEMGIVWDPPIGRRRRAR